MAHLIAGTKTRFDATPKEWLKVGGQLAELANGWAERDDIVAYVGENAGMGIAAACFIPAIAEMEVNVKVAFDEKIKPKYIGNLTDRDVQFDHPPAMGAVLHEAMHARHTRFSLEELHKHKNRHEASLVEWFEETRIEARGIAHYPKNRSFLRASALKLSIADIDAEESWTEGGLMSFSQLLLLTLARVSAGVLDPVDVEPVRMKATAVLGDEVLDQLENIWVRAQAHDQDRDWLPLRDLAREWLDVLKDAGHDAEKEIPAMAIAGGGGGDGDPESGEGEGGTVIVIDMGEMKDALDDAAEDSEMRARAEANRQAINEALEEAAKARAEGQAEQSEAEEAAKEVFGRGTGPVKGSRTNSRLTQKRPPTGDERAAAVVVARELERARYRDRVEVKRRSVMPPGRLNGRAAMQAAVERDRGQQVTAEPWKRTQRYHTEDPELRVGVMVDISGSMSSAMQPMATTAWVLSEAVRRVQGKAAMVYYGTGVFSVLAAGQHLDEVNVYTAPDGTERFDPAFKALNGNLTLLNSSGARLLVIVSDMCYTPDQQAACRKWVTRCVAEGVAVLVLSPTGYMEYIREVCKGLPIQVIEDCDEPTKVATEIGRAAADALTKAGNRA